MARSCVLFPKGTHHRCEHLPLQTFHLSPRRLLVCLSSCLPCCSSSDPYLPSMAAFNALALPGSRFCVERRKGVCLPVWRRLKMIGFWPLWPLDALHYSIPPLPPCPLLFISRRPRGPKHNTLGSQRLRREKQSSTHGYECKTEFNVTC